MSEMHEIIARTEVHTPESLLHLISDGLGTRKTRALILLRGVYKLHGHVSYQQYYYDRIEDDASGYILTARVQRALRQTLNEGQTYLFKGYLTRQVRKEGRIELLYNIVEAVQKVPNTLPSAAEKQVRAYQRKIDKIEQGRLDVTQIIENKLREGDMARVALIIGQQSVIENDIRSALADAISRYELHPFRVNLAKPEELIQQIERIAHSNYDLIAIARGGGAGQEIFDDEDLAYIVADLHTPLVTAIGHADDKHLLDRIADKTFSTPSLLGVYLKTIVTNLEKKALKSQPTDDSAPDTSKQMYKLQTENRRLMAQLHQARAIPQAPPDTTSLAPYIILAIALGFGLGAYLI